MTKKLFVVLVLAAVSAGGVFAQEGSQANAQDALTYKHNAGDMLLGLNLSFLGAMINKNPVDVFTTVIDNLKFDPVESGGTYSLNASIDLPDFFATARILNLGVSFEYYVFHWMSVGTGLGFGPEFNLVTKSGRRGISISGEASEEDVKESAISEVIKAVHLQAGLFLTIPFNVHFNFPKVEWLYGGLGVELHIPVSDAGLDNIINDLIGSNMTKYLPGGSIKGETFVSMPIDIGVDFSSVKANGKDSLSRLFFRIEPEFFKGGFMSLPISIVWQSSLWKLTNAPIPGAR
jgi:hypothetical protein